MNKLWNLLDFIDILQYEWFWKIVFYLIFGIWLFTIYVFVRMVFDKDYRDEWGWKSAVPFSISLVLFTIISILDGSSIFSSVCGMICATFGVVFAYSFMFAFFYGLYAFIRMIFSGGNRKHWAKRFMFSIAVIIGAAVLVMVTDTIGKWLL